MTAPTTRETADHAELAACPFCGGAAEIVHIEEGENQGGSCVCCTACQASGNLEFGRKENFTSNWNRRRREDALLSEIAALRSALDVCNTARLHWQEVVAPALGDRATQSERQRDELRKALEWYGEQARLARLIHREGDAGRHALADDGGKRARQAIANQGADQ